jgi:prepilin-type N-terminal cleavage/methylation domain-containing protein
MKNLPKNTGFSLVEMAIVLAIVSLLMAGLLPMISGQIEQQKRTETRKQLEEIRSALIGYATTQSPPKLPCPAVPSKASGSTGAGVSDCTITTGVLPWVTLGTNETDAWNRRFTYAISPTFATAGITLSATGNLNVLNAPAGSTIATGIPAVIVSHGPNGEGAYNQLGAQLPVSVDPDEIDNYNGGATFVSHDNTPTFDDIVVWVSPNTLFNRLVAAGKLP